MYKAAIFDLDGTLVDSLPDIGNAANMALQYLGLRTFTVAEYKTFAGGGHWRLMEKAITLAQNGLPPTHDELARAVAVKKRQENGPNGHDHTTAYSGVHDMMRELQNRGLQLAILSNKQEPTVRRVVSKLFPDIHFRHVAGEREDTPLKPDPTAAIRILNEDFDDVDASECLFIGDTDIDMKTAIGAGLTPVAVPWGCRKPEQLRAHGAAFVMDKPGDLVKYAFSEAEVESPTHSF